MKFWFYLNKELIDLQSEFEEIFRVDNLYRDYENVYEWIESLDRKSKFYLNVSRPHDWEKGEYDRPIIIIVESNYGIDLIEEDVAHKLKEKFKCDVFAGEIISGKDHQPIISAERKY